MTGHEPTMEERFALIVRHARMLVILYDYYHHYRERGRDRIQPTYERLCHAVDTFDMKLYINDYNDPQKTMIEYRKYLFNYIGGLPGNREVKTQLALTKDYQETINIVE
jgi:hypothetical protein